MVEVHSTLVTDKLGEPRSIFSIKNDVTEKKLEENLIRNLAFVDSLTNLPNRRYFTEKLINTINQLAKTNQYGALFFLDLDKFKLVNDTYGHDAGDSLLQQVANRLKDKVRTNYIIARLGGDEFVVLVNDLGHDPSSAKVAAENIAKNIICTSSHLI